MTRRCGPCTACCTALSVKELPKAAGVRCQHECGKCGIYETRPEACRSFECYWLQGMLQKNERPDLCGVILSQMVGTAWGDVPALYEVWPEAARGVTGEKIIQKFVTAGRSVVVVCTDGTRRVISPKEAP